MRRRTVATPYPYTYSITRRRTRAPSRRADPRCAPVHITRPCASGTGDVQSTVPCFLAAGTTSVRRVCVDISRNVSLSPTRCRQRLLIIISSCGLIPQSVVFMQPIHPPFQSPFVVVWPILPCVIRQRTQADNQRRRCRHVSVDGKHAHDPDPLTTGALCRGRKRLHFGA